MTHLLRLRVALVVASALTLVDTAVVHLRIAFGDGIPVPWFDAYRVGPLVVVGHVLWVVGTAACWPGRSIRLGWLLPIGSAVALAADQQTSNTYGLLLVVFSAVIWWVARMEERGHPEAYVPLTILRAQISIVYAWTMFGKLQALFLSGAILQAAWTGPASGLLTPSGAVFRGLAVVTVVFEAAVALMIWIPGLRRAAVVVAMGFHVTTLLFLEPTIGLAAFTATMAVGYVAIWNRVPDRPRRAMVAA